MAANFGDTIIEGSIAPTVAVQAPVQDDSGAVLAQALQPSAKAIGAIAGSIFEGGIASKKATVLSELNNKWTDYADAVDQGAMTQSEARMRIRRDFRETTANDPTLYEDVNKLHATFITASGMGHIIDQGTVEQQAQDDVTKAAITAGYPTVQAYRDHLQSGVALTALNDKYSDLKARGDIATQADLNESISAATQFTRTALPWAQTRINQAMKDIELHPENKAQIAAQLNTEIMDQVNQIDSLTGPLKADYITTPVKGLLQTFNDYSTGKVEAEVLTGEITNTQLKLKYMYQAANPQLAEFIAKSSILKDVGLESQNYLLFDQNTIKKLFDNSNPTTPPANLTDGTNDSTIVLQHIRDAAGRVDETDDPQLKQDVATQINQVIDGLYVNERAVSDPVNFREGVEFLGSPQVKEFINANGGIGGKYAKQSEGVIRSQYETALLPVINERWLSTVPVITPSNIATGNPDTVVGGMQNIPMSELLVPRWNGNAVEFSPAPGYESNPRIIALAEETNSGANSIATPLNNLINAYSTLTGEDGGKIYEEQFASRLFNAGKEDIAARVNKTLDNNVSRVDDSSIANPEGLMSHGNIDIDNRQVVKNDDGSISTEESMSFEEDGVEVLVPTVFDGKHHTNDEAIAHYQETGQHLGKFDTPANADKFAESLHNRQEAFYSSENTIEDFNSEDLKVNFGMADELLNQGSSLEAIDIPLIDPAQVGDVGVDFDSYLPAIRSSESGGNDSATNPTSTATGRYQFLKSTWNDLVNKYPNSGLTFDGRTDPQQQEVAIRIFTANNANYLKTKGVDVNNGNLYAAHFLGAGDAAIVLQAPDTALVSDYVPARVINANSFLKGMTIAKFKAWASRKGN